MIQYFNELSITVSNGEIHTTYYMLYSFYTIFYVKVGMLKTHTFVLALIYLFFNYRGGMIQTHEQYEFIHQALCEYEKDLAEPVSNCQPHH